MSYFTTNLKCVIIYSVFGWQTSNVHYYFERLVIMYVEKSRIGQIIDLRRCSGRMQRPFLIATAQPTYSLVA